MVSIVEASRTHSYGVIGKGYEDGKGDLTVTEFCPVRVADRFRISRTVTLQSAS
jgi:hypothetical protein